MPNRKSANRLPAILIAFSLLLLMGCMPKRSVVLERRMPLPERREGRDRARDVEKRESKEVQYGVASWYGPDFHGRPTSSGEIYDMHQLTCAHNTLPLGTIVMVTNLDNGKSLELKVNDRGPFVKERIIDLSYAAAQMLGVWEKGTALVKVEVVALSIEPVQRFTLQVGSFVEETKAQKLADQLRENFENVHVSALETFTQKYYRVRVGQFDNRDAALGLAEKLSRMGLNVLVTSR
jgi:rare lipoprotein A